MSARFKLNGNRERAALILALQIIIETRLATTEAMPCDRLDCEFCTVCKGQATRFYR